MSIIVEHDKRRKEILEKALDVFMDEGFEDTTLQKIADRCGITRTTLYIYFKNKKEIFNYSIKQLLAEVEQSITVVCEDKNLSAPEKLIGVISDIIDRLEENRLLLSVVLDYLRHLSRGDHDPENKVRRRTVKLRHILSSMVIEGVRRGELRPINIKDADELLYSLIEAAIFRLVVLKRSQASELKQIVRLTVNMLVKPPAPDSTSR